MGTINLATKYEKKVDERFKLGSLTEAFVNNDYNWTGVESIKIYNIPTVALNDYQRSGTSRYGIPAELEDVITEYKLTTDKAFTYTIDKGNNQDQMNVKDAGKSLRREIDEIITPAKDMQRLKVMAEKAASLSNIGTGSITKSNAYEKFLDGQKTLDNYKVPVTNRVAAVSASFYAKLKLDDSFTKAGDMATKIAINGLVGEVDGVKIIKVPDSYLPTNCEFIIAHPSATVSPAKLTDYKIHDNPPGINGNLVEGRVRFDTFVLTAKENGIYAHYTEAPVVSIGN